MLRAVCDGGAWCRVSRVGEQSLRSATFAEMRLLDARAVTASQICCAARLHQRGSGSTASWWCAAAVLSRQTTRIRPSVPRLISLLAQIGCPCGRCALSLRQSPVCWPWRAGCRRAPATEQRAERSLYSALCDYCVLQLFTICTYKSVPFLLKLVIVKSLRCDIRWEKTDESSVV